MKALGVIARWYMNIGTMGVEARGLLLLLLALDEQLKIPCVAITAFLHSFEMWSNL